MYMNMSKITPLCKWMRIILLLLIFAIPIAIAINWLSGAHNGLSTIPSNLLPLVDVNHTLSPQEKTWGLIVSLIPAAFAIAIMYAFAIVFKQFSHGEIFTGPSISGFRWAAALIIIWEIVQPAYDILMGMVLTPNHMASIKFIQYDISNLRGLIIGIVLFVIARVIAEARNLKSEVDLTI